MAFLDFLSGVVEAIGFDDLVGDFLGNIGIDFGDTINGVISGAVTNAAVAGISGGDIGKAALFGAVGGGLSDTNFGSFGNEIGGAISGYGLADSMGGSGLLGALSGGVGAYYNDMQPQVNGTSGGNDLANDVKQDIPDGGGSIHTTNGAAGRKIISGTDNASGGFSLLDKMREMGLVDKDGKATLLGEAALGVGAGLGEQMMTEDLLDKQQEQAIARAEKASEIKQEEEQNRIAFFTNPQNNYQINRSR